MKKINIILLLLNILIGIMIFCNYFFIFNFQSYSIPLFILLLVFYTIMLLLYFKTDKKMKVVDIIFSSLYYLFIISIFIFSMIYQVNNYNTFNLLYFTKYMVVPHLLYIFYYIIKTHN